MTFYYNFVKDLSEGKTWPKVAYLVGFFLKLANPLIFTIIALMINLLT